MSTLYLIRHAEPALKDVLLGASDPPLSEAGKREAALIALPGVAIVYASALRRARDTASAIGTNQIVIDPDLNEISYGQWDGRHWSEIEAQYPDQAKAKLACWKGVTAPGGEDWEIFTHRVARALRRICEGVFPAAVVAHAAVNATIAHLLTGQDSLGFTQRYCEVLTYEV